MEGVVVGQVVTVQMSAVQAQALSTHPALGECVIIPGVSQLVVPKLMDTLDHWAAARQKKSARAKHFSHNQIDFFDFFVAEAEGLLESRLIRDSWSVSQSCISCRCHFAISPLLFGITQGLRVGPCSRHVVRRNFTELDTVNLYSPLSHR